MKRRNLLLILIFFSLPGFSQELWSLERAVTYALQNNISVKQADINRRLALINQKQSQASRLPSLDFSTGAGYNFGRSVNPVTNAFENRSLFFANYGLQSGVNLFNWFSLRYSIKASDLQAKAAEAGLEKARSDIALNVAVAYLNVLLSNEQVGISQVQAGQTKAQLEIIRKQVSAGALPELEAVQVEAQLARDSATYITALSAYQQNLLLLKALLNLEMSQPFDVEKPDVSAIPVEPLSALQPDVVYALALKNLPQQKANDLSYQAALLSAKSARAQMCPSLSAFVSIGSNYVPGYPDETRAILTPNGLFDTIGAVEVSPGVIRAAVRPKFDVSVPSLSFGQQFFDVNLRQAVGLNLSVPIFRNRALRSNWERTKLDAETIGLVRDQSRITLQSDIYTAYTNAVNAEARYRSTRTAVDAAERAFSFSQRRFDVGLLSTFELITNQNNLFRARLDASLARYEYVFRLKLLEFYKGEGLRLQ